MAAPLPLWVPWLSLHLLGSAAFNLDVTNTLLKDGDKGSLFGFSVALHRQLRPEPASWLLVGAPQAPALPGQGANRTGGLYACPLSHETSDCWRVPIDDGVDLQRESKENQWLGVSVKSQGAGGKIVTCAHLYEARNRVQQPLETRDVIGRCFVLSQDLRVRDELDGGEWKFCEGRPQGHDRFGFCQQGLAAGFTADNHYILFGAPGTYNWKGNLRVELFNHSSLDLAHYDDGPYEAGGEKDQNPSLIPVPANSYLGILFVTNIDSSDPDQLVYKSPEPSEKVPGTAGDVAQNSYLGFSVDSGRGLTRRSELSFVSGAPRANHTGAVVILRRDSANRLVPEAVLPGEQLSSSFGYAVAVLEGEDGTAVFAMSDQKDVALEIHVTNLPSDPAEPQRDGDDAHEALLTATFPEALPYSAVRPYDARAPADKPVLCLANQNGSQVECELGNPLPRGAQVSVYLDPGAAVAGGVPWWVVLLAALAGILVLALLVFGLWKLGFFRRARYEPPALPQHHAVKIPREQRPQFREGRTGIIQRQEWAAGPGPAPDGHLVPSSA
ncbi:integrin alpha-7-like [Apteryx rowi]|uniref:integrin alpha-7-like n=1 Tax=Apteryx rowi TaxID=308060 RepID=UPI000E1DB306|nr:integrin alpha-7-like [Apteryx rowi]